MLLNAICIEAGDIAYWHETDQSARSDDVRSTGADRKWSFGAVRTVDDPKTTSGNNPHACDRVPGDARKVPQKQSKDRWARHRKPLTLSMIKADRCY